MTVSELTLVEAPPPDDDHRSTDRTPPFNRDAEIAVLGSLMLDPTVIPDVTPILEAPDFYVPRHELIYHAIVASYEALEPADVIAVTNRLEATGQLTRAGGPAYLHHVTQSVIVTTNATYYADIVAHTAARRRVIEAGTRITQLGHAMLDGGDPFDLIARAEAELASAAPRPHAGAEPTLHPWEPVDLTHILANGDVIEQPTVLARADGICLLYPGAVHSISGEPESGKSWVGLIACAQELNAGAHVGYVDFEDRPGRIVGRLLHLGAHPDRIRDRFHYVRPNTGLDRLGTNHLERTLAHTSLVVLDGITEAMALHGLSVNDLDDVARFLHMLPRHVANLGPAVLQIDHVPKNPDTQGRFAIGSQHKLAGLDGAAFGIKVLEAFARGKVGRARIVVHKDREGAVREQAAGHTIAELHIDSTNGSMLARLDVPAAATHTDDGTFRPTILMERVSRYLEDHPDQSGSQIEAAVKGNAAAKRDALRILVLEGYLSTEPGPRGAVHYASDTPFRHNGDSHE